MKSCLITLGFVCLLTGAVTAQAETYEPQSEKALHFRLEVGVKAGHVVSGWIDIRDDGGSIHDSVGLDLDRDGTVETLRTFPKTQDYRTKEMVYRPQIVIEHEDARWQLDPTIARFPAVPAAKAGTARPGYVRWSVTAGDFYAWFINGRIEFHTTAEAAAAAKPIRMGPPFHFQTGTRTRGREALVSVGLKDGHGGTLRLARIGRGEVRPRVRLLQDGKQRYETWAAYG